MEKIAVKLSENFRLRIKDIYKVHYYGNNGYFHFPNYLDKKGIKLGHHCHPNVMPGYKEVSEDEFFEIISKEENKKEVIPESDKTDLSYEEEISTFMSKGFIEKTPSHYDNTNGSLYQIAKQRGWDFYQADCVKRLDRAYKKGQFREDLQKTKDLIDLWLKEMEEMK